MNWQEEYKRKFVQPEEAAMAIKSGDKVVIPYDTPVQALSTALIQRKSELENVRVLLRSPRIDLGWLKGDLRPAFDVMIDTQAGEASRAINEKGVDFIPFLTSLRFKADENGKREPELFNVAMIIVSPPDAHGYCRFGPYLSHKKDYAKRSKIVLAEVSDEPEMMARTFGDNYIHISEIDYFVQHVQAVNSPNVVEKPHKPDKEEQYIAEYVSSLVNDGDTIQLGGGAVASSLMLSADFGKKQDLGCHSAFIGTAFLKLIKAGIINGRRKNINPGKAVSGGMLRLSNDELNFVNDNPLFEVRNMSYVNNIQVIASHDHMVAINGILAIDLAGQIAADTLKGKMYGGAGGQIDFAIGSMLSKGGRSISVLRSTTGNGTISRILPRLETGTIASVPWTFADYVVTENGIAKLWGKSLRQRAEELISVAHPDFRSELRKRAAMTILA